MGNHLTKCCCIGASIYQPLESEQREELDELFHHITSSATVDYTNQEIKDIQNAVSIMLERIRTRINIRGIFNIDRIVPSGSMAEQISLWKFSDENHYLEFDFLSVLKNKIIQCEDQPSQQCCIAIVMPPVEYERMKQYYNTEGEFFGVDLRNKDVISGLFLNQINYCLTSSCDCLTLQCDKNEFGYFIYEISFRPSSLEHNHGCGECIVDMPTGTLHVNTEINIYQGSHGPNKCSLIFQWISKAKSLSALDELLLQRPQPIYSLPIYVDFLPALESLKPTSPGGGDEHDFFIVPKNCNVCKYGSLYRWRKSWCMAELHAFSQEMSDKHRRCFQIMKYFSDARLWDCLPNYHIKTLVLRHHTTCSDTTDDTVECVMEMFRDLLRAYKTNKLLSYQSNLNILKDDAFVTYYGNSCERYITRLCSVSDTDTWETFIRKCEEDEGIIPLSGR